MVQNTQTKWRHAAYTAPFGHPEARLSAPYCASGLYWWAGCANDTEGALGTRGAQRRGVTFLVPKEDEPIMLVGSGIDTRPRRFLHAEPGERDAMWLTVER